MGIINLPLFFEDIWAWLTPVWSWFFIVDEPEEPEELFRITVALRGVKHSEYFNIVAHYYGLTERDAEAQIPELMKRILKEMYKVAGYHNANVDDFRISDVARIRYEQRLVGEIEMEEEWEL